MTCLPATGGPSAGLLLLGLGLLALGFVLTCRKRTTRAVWASTVILAVLTASTLSTTDAQASADSGGPGTSQSSDDCPPGGDTGAGGDADEDGDGDGDGDGTATRYDVTYAASTGGTIDGPATQRVRAGRDAEPVTAVPDATYRFTGWSDGVTTPRRHDTDVDAAIQATAQFALLQYTLTYAAGTGGTVGGTSPQTVDHGTDGTAVTAVPAPGHSFVRWSDGSTANPRTDTNVVADLSVTAEFSAVTYRLTYAAGPNGSLSGDDDQSVAHGADGSPVTAVPAAGFRFVRWSDGSTANPRTDGNAVADLDVTAEFATLTYRLQYAAGTGGSVTGDLDQQVDHGDDASTVTAVPAAGYEFLRWSDGSTTNPRTDTNVTADATVAAVFAIDEYAVTYTAGAGGTITGDASQSVEHGANATSVSAVPAAGFRFVRWSDGSTANPRTDTNITADLSVTAEFAALEYTLTYTAGANGSIGGTTPQTVEHGADGSAVSAVPAAGYRFVQWSDGSTANPRTDTNITADLTVTAQFAVLTYRVRYLADTGGSLTGDVDQTVNHGAPTTSVTAVPDAGWQFTGWSDGSTANPRTDTNVVADLTVTAEFEEGIVLPLHGMIQGEASGGTPERVVVRNTGAGQAEYLLVPTNTSGTPAATTVSVTGNAPLTPTNPTGSLSGVDTHSADRIEEVALAQAARGGVGTGAPVGQLPAGAVPAIGDTLTINGGMARTCATGEAITATVERVGANVVIATDVANPLGGLGITELDDVLEAAEAVYTGVTDTLGATSDVDQNGRVVIVITRKVNELAPPATPADSYVRSRPRDLLDQVECPTSNVGEVFYAMAPDTLGEINSNVRTRSSVAGTIPSHFAHELGHQIMDAARLDSGAPLDGTWLGEAIADTALDAAFYATSFGLQPLQNIVVSQITTGPNASRRVAAFNTYINQNYGRYRSWLQAPGRHPVLWSSPTAGARGGAWQFLSYAADRSAGGTVSGRAAFLRALVTSDTTGTPALAAATGADPVTWLRDFTFAVYADDAPDSGALGTSGPFSMLSWNNRSIYTALNTSYQLAVATLDTGALVVDTYAARGGSRYLRFAVAAGGTATVTLTSGGISYRLVRLV